jgi:hypothetical protein
MTSFITIEIPLHIYDELSIYSFDEKDFEKRHNVILSSEPITVQAKHNKLIAVYLMKRPARTKPNPR